MSTSGSLLDHHMNRYFIYVCILKTRSFLCRIQGFNLIRPGPRHNALLTRLLPVRIPLRAKRLVTHGSTIDQGAHEIFVVKAANLIIQKSPSQSGRVELFF